MARTVALVLTLLLVSLTAAIRPVRYDGRTISGTPVTADRWVPLWEQPADDVALRDDERPDEAGAYTLYPRVASLRLGRYAANILGALALGAVVLTLMRPKPARPVEREPRRLA